MKTRITKATLTLLVLFLTGTMAFPQPPAGKVIPGVPPRTPHYAVMQNMLNLTDEQKDQIKQMRLNMMKEMLPLRNQMAVLKAEYRMLITAEKPSKKEINANIDKQTALMNKMKKARADHMLKMRNILTEEQWLMIQSHKGMKGRGGMRGGPGMKARGTGMGMGPCGMSKGPRPGMAGRGMGMGPAMWSDTDNDK